MSQTATLNDPGQNDGQIPKIIHYVWVGPKRFPTDAAEMVEKWRQLLPGYQFIRWTEENIDFTPKFIRQAYSMRAYNRVANYARVAALHKFGGIYMDHDVELLKPFDDLLGLGFFAGFQTLKADAKDIVNNAVVGSVPGHRFPKWVMDTLDTMDGAYNWGSNSGPGLFSKLLREEGPITPSTELQKRGDLYLCPPAYFYPYEWNQEFSPDCITDETYAVHHWAHTWKAKQKPKFSERLVAAGLRRAVKVSPTLTSLAVRTLNAIERASSAK